MYLALKGKFLKLTWFPNSNWFVVNIYVPKLKRLKYLKTTKTGISSSGMLGLLKVP